MKGTFGAGIDHLIEATGEGKLVGSVEVDQIYAHYQEANDHLRHPRGGKAHALQDSLFEQSKKYMRELAKRTVTKDGSDIESAMIDNMEHLSEQYFQHAPVEWGDLKASGHPTVTSDDATIYDRPPNMHRLSKDELEAKGDLRRVFGEDHL